MANESTIHASAVLVGARALLIVGPSGSGKSYLALKLLQAGDAAASISAYARLDGDYKTFFEYFSLAEQYYGDAAKAAKVQGLRAVAKWGQQYAHIEMEHQREREAGTYGKVKQ